MADYVLTDGKGTVIRQSDPMEEGYVDLDLNELSDSYSSLEDADKMVVQRGVSDPATATVAVVRAGLQTTLTDVDWLNMAYIY